MGDRFRLWEYVGFPITGGCAIARVVDISEKMYNLQYLNDMDIDDNRFYKEFIDRECISLGMNQELIEVLFF
jgi:hypothetical protein